MDYIESQKPKRIYFKDLSSEIQSKIANFVKSQQSSLEKNLISDNEMVYIRNYEDYVLFRGNHIIYINSFS